MFKKPQSKAKNTSVTAAADNARVVTPPPFRGPKPTSAAVAVVPAAAPKLPPLPTASETNTAKNLRALMFARPRASSAVITRWLTGSSASASAQALYEILGAQHLRNLLSYPANVCDSIIRGAHRPAKPAALHEKVHVLTAIYDEIVAAIASGVFSASEDPFEFLSTLSQTRLQKILADESPRDIALLAGFITRDGLSRVLSCLGDEKRRLTLEHMMETPDLPREAIERIVLMMSKRFTDLIKRESELEKTGKMLWVLAAGNPDSAKAGSGSKSDYFSFENLGRLPAAVISATFRRTRMEVLALAFMNHVVDPAAQQLYREAPAELRAQLEKMMHELYANPETASRLQGAARTVFTAMALQELRVWESTQFTVAALESKSTPEASA